MAIIECRSAQPGVPSVAVEVSGITDSEVTQARQMLDDCLNEESQVADGVAAGFIAIVKMCPQANPSDLWLHVVYRHLLDSGWSDNRWKRVSGYALERAFSRIYQPRLAEYELSMNPQPTGRARAILQRMGLDVAPSKVDLFLRGVQSGSWLAFGVAHVKASIAERIQDDVPASIAAMEAGFVSIILTMDAKAFPPPHGDCVNYGELGGRSINMPNRQRIKREYIEVHGQFDGLFSFNLRTPESSQNTPSGKRIHTLSLSDPYPDALVQFLVERWCEHTNAL